jgi:hypothetical protein
VPPVVVLPNPPPPPEPPFPPIAEPPGTPRAPYPPPVAVMDEKTELFTKDIIRTLAVTAIAIIIYNIFFRKIIKPKLKKVKSACYINIGNTSNVSAIYGAK